MGWPTVRTASVALLPGLFPPALSTLDARVRRALLLLVTLASTLGAVAWIALSRSSELRWPIAVAVALSLAAAGAPWHRLADGAFAVVGAAAAAWVVYAIWATGGERSPFSPLAIVPVILVALAAPPRAALPLGLVFAALPALPILYGTPSPTEIQHLLTLVGTCAAVAVVGTMLMREARAAADVDRRTSMRSDHYAVVAHELRNPLVGIGAMSRVLGLQLHDSPHAPHVAAMEAETKAALALLDDLSDLAAIESRRLVLASARIDLGALVRRIADAMQYVQHPIVVTGAIDPVMVIGDEQGIAQVLRNLLSNAAKFSPDGAAIGVSVAVERPGAVVSVRDGGTGVPAEERSQLFQKFTRLSTAGGTRGSGLGLYISRRLANDLGGDLWAEWPQEGGSVFRFSLPVAPPS